jgi:DNA-binding GntR family transcriptional regulator
LQPFRPWLARGNCLIKYSVIVGIPAIMGYPTWTPTYPVSVGDILRRDYRMPDPASDTKLVNQIVERIHAKIALGEYGPGDRLLQELLAEEFRVSRTPIREALRLLEAKGVISQAHRHSAVIRVPSAREIRETYQVRAELEGLATQLAAQWISDNQLDDLKRIHNSFLRSVKELSEQRARARRSERSLLKASNTWIDTNGEFHSLIQTASNNLRLRHLIGELYVGFTSNVMYSSARGMDTHRMQQNINDHEKILRALEKRDADLARSAMQTHILESGTFVIAWLENHLSN